MTTFEKDVKGDTKLPLKINPKAILSFYLFLPLTVIIILIDRFFLGSSIKSNLVKSPEDLFVFKIFFIIPHVHASFFSVFDRDYISHYKKQIAIGVPVIIAVALFLPMVIGEKMFLFITAAWTAKHLVYQQFAIAPLLSLGRSKLNVYWEWIGVFLSVLMYSVLFPDESYFDLHDVLKYATPFLVPPFLYYTYFIAKNSQKKVGLYYVWANAAMILIGVMEYFLGYGFFAIFSIRIIHDFTGFYFYICHDTNRAREKRNNYLYRFFGFINLPIFILCPLLAILFAMPFNLLTNPESSLAFLSILTMSHYYFDSIEWKKDSIHRKYILVNTAE